jgi:hypothetical protein
MRIKKENYILVGFAVILATIMIIIATIVLKTPSTPTPTQQTTNIAPSLPVTSITLISPSIQAQAVPPIAYDTNAQNKMLAKINNHSNLSQSDSAVKKKILTLLPSGQDGGVVYASSDFQISYIKAFDLFQVEILTTNIAQAKDEVNVWFRQQGASQEGICNYPVDFYLGNDVAKQLKGSSVPFSPLPNSC